MALVVKDRVRVITTTTGTSDFSLGSAVTGYQSFSVIGNNNTTYYVAVDPSTGDWEVGVGTFLSAGPTLTRDTILESSNAGSKVVFAAGAKDVFVSYPAERAVYLNAAGSAVDVLDIGTLGTSTANISNANITAGTVATTPTSATDIANKSYVDTIASSGITYHTPVKYEVPNTTGNLNATYNNGVSGVGATLTNAGTKAAFAPDGPTAQVGDRILIYNQTNAFENGIYEVTTVGTPDPGGTNWVLTRTSDANSYGVKDPNKLGNGDAFFITSGNTGAGETYVCNTVGTITFGTTAITFVQVSDATLYTAGTGLTLSGTQFSITPVGTAGTYGSASQVPVIVTNASGQVSSVTNTAIAISAGAVSGLAASATTDTTNAANITSGTLPTARLSGSYTGISGVGTLTAGTWNASTIGAAYGGTGLTSYTVGDLLYADTTTSLAKLADVVVGNALISGGVGTAPSWGKIGLTTHVSGTLGVANGGTGAATLTGYVYGNGTGPFTASTSIPNGATTATSANTASAIVARDASGNFSAGTITAALSGNASTATSATTATNLAGGSVGTIPYQTAAATTAMLAVGTSGQYLKSNGAAAPSWDNLPAVNNGTLTMNVAGTGLSGSATFTANQSGNSTFTVSSNATSSNTASTIVARDASGNFSAGTITASLSGNATSATTSTNLAGGSAGTVPYQSAAGTTAMLAAGTAGYYLQANGAAAPSWVAPPTIGNGTLTMNVSGNGLSGSQTFTANQSGNATYTVTSNATSANTASTIVFRDASGNFNAGIVTATRGGYALPDTGASAQWIYLGRWSGMTQAGAKLQIKIVSASGFNASIAQNCLTEIYFKTSNGSSFQAGSTGNFFADGQAWRTGPNATTPSTIRVVETNTTTYDIYGNFASYSGVNSFYTVSVANGSWTHSGTIVTPTGNSIDLPVYQILDSNNYNIYAPTLTGTGASGTWGINITGNAATATTAGNVNNGTLTMNVSGTGLSGSATFTANQAGNSTFTVTSNATDLNTASTIVARNASGNFAAGTITASLSGNATSATTATNLAGGSVGTVPYQSAAGTTAMLAAGTAGQYLQSNGAAAPSWATLPTIGNGTLSMGVSGNGLSGSATFTANQSGGATFTVTSNATAANTANTIAYRDANGGFAIGYVNNNTWYNYNDNDRNAGSATYYPNASARAVRYFFANASSTGTGGNYAGVLQFNPWDGTTASTGDASYQLAFGSTATNGNGIPQLNIRKGIDTTWNSWYTILHSGNYNSYSPTLSGAGASGTWGINVTGSSSTSGDSSLLNGISAVNLYNNMGQVHSTRTSFDATTPSYGFGYRFVQGNTNGPGTGGSQFYSWYIGLGSEYAATGAGSYGAMFAVDRASSTPYLSVRFNEANTFGVWRRIQAGYADSSGSVTNAVTFNNGGAGGASGSTFNGSSALTVSYNTVGAPSTTGTNASGTWGINITGNAATATTASNVNNGTLTMNVSGNGLSGSQTFTANQSSAATFTVTSNATSANTASTIVFRDASGNFSANAVTIASDSTISTLTIGRGAGSVASNTALGVNALSSNTTGFSNTAVGNGALVSNTTSNSSTAIGNDAMYYMRGDSNTAIGRQAMLGSLTAANNTGAGNVAVGFFAARTITSGNQNTALGTNSLRNVTTGSNNVGVGGETLYNLSSQINNVAVGFQTLYYMGGTANIGIGYLAMVGSTTPANNFGSYNIALGQEALAKVTSGSYNIAIGYQALDANTTASSNVAIGTSTLGLATTATQNVAVGSAALAATTGSQNTAIGESAGTSITTGSKNTIIGRYTGNQGGLNIATLSNYIVLSDGDGNPRGYFDNNGNYIVGADIRSTSQNGGQMTGFRNMVINGGMVIDQRNNGAAVVYTAATQTYVVDRFGCFGTLAGKFTIQRNQGSVTPPAGFSNYLGVTSSAATTPGATDLYALFHKIEGFNFSRASFGTANAQSLILSFWVRSSLTGTFGGGCFNSAANRNYVFSYTISAANTWERKSITIPGDTTGTWLTDNGVGFQWWTDLGSGSSNRGAAGSWTTNVFYGVTGGASIVGTSGATFYITGVQLEVGTAVTPFEHRNVATEFSMCQRYYEVGSDISLWSGYAVNGSTYYSLCRFATTKRASPTVVSTYVAAAGFPATAPATLANRSDQFWASAVCNVTSNGGYFQFSWTANAEL